jgi:hypothetical protein
MRLVRLIGSPNDHAVGRRVLAGDTLVIGGEGDVFHTNHSGRPISSASCVSTAWNTKDFADYTVIVPNDFRTRDRLDDEALVHSSADSEFRAL